MSYDKNLFDTVMAKYEDGYEMLRVLIVDTENMILKAGGLNPREGDVMRQAIITTLHQLNERGVNDFNFRQILEELNIVDDVLNNEETTND